MPEPPLALDNEFWRFSGAVYADAGVERACLALQDGSGVDVNLALLCAWIGAARGGVAASEDLGAAAALVSEWHAEAVAPLRAARRRVKALALLADPAVAAFRARVAAVELEAERIQQALLFRWADPRWPPRGRRSGQAAANLGVLLRRTRDPVPPDAIRAAGTLADASERHAAVLSAR